MQEVAAAAPQSFGPTAYPARQLETGCAFRDRKRASAVSSFLLLSVSEAEHIYLLEKVENIEKRKLLCQTAFESTLSEVKSTLERDDG